MVEYPKSPSQNQEEAQAKHYVTRQAPLERAAENIRAYSALPMSVDNLLDTLEKAIDRAAQMKIAFELLEHDPHQWSKRGCATCRNISRLLEREFGCVYYATHGHRPGVGHDS